MVMTEMNSWWLRDSLNERLSMLNVSDEVRRHVTSLSDQTDLREVEIPGLSRGRDRGFVIQHLLVAPMHGFTHPFEIGYPTGPLGGIQVYSTDAYGEWSGKAHAPGCCTHADVLREDDQLLNLDGWIEQLPSLRSRSFVDSEVCSKCGGYAVRLLSSANANLVTRVLQFLPALSEYQRIERAPMRPSDYPIDTLRSVWDRLNLALADAPDPATATSGAAVAFERRVLESMTADMRRVELRINNASTR